MGPGKTGRSASYRIDEPLGDVRHEGDITEIMFVGQDEFRFAEDDLREFHNLADVEIVGNTITDLGARGVKVWDGAAAGEFGRTPTAELPNDSGGNGTGRDHNHHGFSVWMAGGGVKGGTVYGATDEFGFKAVEKPVQVHDLHATMLHLLGLDHERLTFRHAGRDFRLTDVHGRVIHDWLA